MLLASPPSGTRAERHNCSGSHRVRAGHDYTTGTSPDLSASLHMLWMMVWTTDDGGGVAKGASWEKTVADEAAEDFSSAWAKTLANLESLDIGPQQRAFLSQARPITLVEGTAVVAVPSDFARAQIEQRLRTHIVDALTGVLGRPVGLAVTVTPPPSDDVGSCTAAEADAEASPAPPPP